MRTIAALAPGGEEPAFPLLRGLQQKIRHEYGFGLAVAVSSRFENLFEHTRCLSAGAAALQFAFYDQSTPHSFAELDCEPSSTAVDRFQGEDHLSAVLMSGEWGAVQKAFDDALDAMLGPPRPQPAGLKRGILNLVMSLTRRVGGVLCSDRLDDVMDMAALIENAATLDEARQLAHDILRTLAATITNRKADLQAGAVEQGKRMIEREYAKPLSLEEVSRRFLLQPVLLQHAVQKHGWDQLFGIPYDVRLTHAKRILVSGDEPISAVAARCGYNDCSYFARVFKRDAGCTPDEYRKIQGRESRGGGRA